MEFFTLFNLERKEGTNEWKIKYPKAAKRKVALKRLHSAGKSPSKMHSEFVKQLAAQNAKREEAAEKLKAACKRLNRALDDEPVAGPSRQSNLATQNEETKKKATGSQSKAKRKNDFYRTGGPILDNCISSRVVHRGTQPDREVLENLKLSSFLKEPEPVAPPPVEAKEVVLGQSSAATVADYDNPFVTPQHRIRPPSPPPLTPKYVVKFHDSFESVTESPAIPAPTVNALSRQTTDSYYPPRDQFAEPPAITNNSMPVCYVCRRDFPGVPLVDGRDEPLQAAELDVQEVWNTPERVAQWLRQSFFHLASPAAALAPSMRTGHLYESTSLFDEGSPALVRNNGLLCCVHDKAEAQLSRHDKGTQVSPQRFVCSAPASTAAPHIWFPTPAHGAALYRNEDQPWSRDGLQSVQLTSGAQGAGCSIEQYQVARYEHSRTSTSVASENRTVLRNPEGLAKPPSYEQNRPDLPNRFLQYLADYELGHYQAKPDRPYTRSAYDTGDENPALRTPPGPMKPPPYEPRRPKSIARFQEDPCMLEFYESNKPEVIDIDCHNSGLPPQSASFQETSDRRDAGDSSAAGASTSRKPLRTYSRRVKREDSNTREKNAEQKPPPSNQVRVRPMEFLRQPSDSERAQLEKDVSTCRQSWPTRA